MVKQVMILLSLLMGMAPTIFFTIVAPEKYKVISVFLVIVPTVFIFISNKMAVLSLICSSTLMYILLSSIKCSSETQCMTLGLTSFFYPLGYFFGQCIIGLPFLYY